MRLPDEQYTRTPFSGIRKMTDWLHTEGYKVNRKDGTRLLRLMESMYPKTTLESTWSCLTEMGSSSKITALCLMLEKGCKSNSSFLITSRFIKHLIIARQLKCICDKKMALSQQVRWWRIYSPEKCFSAFNIA